MSLVPIRRGAKGVFAAFLFGGLVAQHAIADSLEQVVQDTIQSNPEVLASYSSLKAAYYQDKSTLSRYLPSLVLTGDVGREHTDNDNRPSKRLNRKQARLELRQPLYRGGESTAESDRTEAEFMAASLRVKEVSENVSLEIVETYLNVLKAKELVLLAQENLDMHYKTQEKVNQRHEQGVGDKADIAQIKGRISRAEANLNNARNELMDARSRYISLVGKLPISLTRPQTDDGYLPKTRSDAQQIAMANNPALLSTRYNVSSAEAQLKGRKSAYHPDIDFVLNGGRQKNVSGFDGNEEDARAVIELNWNLFNGTRDMNESKTYKYRAEQAQMESNNTRRLIMERIDLIWGSYLRNQRNIELLRAYVVAAKDAERLYEAQFKVSRRSLLDLLDSANELFEARKSYLEAEYNLVQDEYKVIHAVGFLLESMRIDIENTIKEELESE